MTTQTGGLGITLTGADRVIIYDPFWNPASDNQAVDRAYRIGQKQDVVVYRLVTCGTIEEKIFRRQVFKDALAKSTTEDGDSGRILPVGRKGYFSQEELRELFKLGDTETSETRAILEEKHAFSVEKQGDRTLFASEAALLDDIDGIDGVSNRGLVYGETTEVDDDDDGDEPNPFADLLTLALSRDRL